MMTMANAIPMTGSLELLSPFVVTQIRRLNRIAFSGIALDRP